jgi:hypothetical protein
MKLFQLPAETQNGIPMVPNIDSQYLSRKPLPLVQYIASKGKILHLFAFENPSATSSLLQ